MKLKFKIDEVEALIAQTKDLIVAGADPRAEFDEPGLILASQYGAGVHLMSSMVSGDGEWTSRIVFAEQCNPNANDFDPEIGVAAYGELETAELIPIDKVERVVVTARGSNSGHVVIQRSA